MARSREENDRLDRLAGSGEGWGGGLPLPLSFAAILNELIDYVSATTGRLTEVVAGKLEFKRSQVMSVWPSWEAFTLDLLAQMEARGVVAREDGVWYTGGKFDTGKYLEIIPSRTWKGKRYRGDGVTVWEKEERDHLNRADHSEREATSLVGNFRPALPGHISEIRQSEAQVGQLYPVLVDQHGRILDGGHRKAANPNWREHKITVESEEMALAIGLWANSGKPLAPKIQARVTELIGDLAGTSQIKRDRAAAALRADPSQSNRTIARQVGCDHKTVAEERSDLQETGEIPQFKAEGGRGVTTGKRSTAPRATGPQYDKEGLRSEIERLRRAGLPVDRDAMMARFGCGEGTVQSMRSQVDAVLEAEAALTGARREDGPGGPAVIAEPEPESHAHDWGPWVRVRQCTECGEQEVEDTDEPYA